MTFLFRREQCVMLASVLFCLAQASLGQSVTTDSVTIDRLYDQSKKYWNKKNDSARYFLDQVKALSEKTDYKRGQAYALYGYGVVEPVLYKQFQYFTKSLDLFEDLHDPFGIGLNLVKIGTIYQTIGQQEKALDYFKASLAVKKKTNDNGGIALTLINIGKYYEGKGDLQEALAQYKESLVYRLKEGTEQGIGYSQVNIAQVLYEQGQFDKAYSLSDSAFHNFLPQQDITGQTWSLLVKGKSLVKMGRLKEAEQTFQSLSKYPAPFQYLEWAIAAKKELIKLVRNRGDIQAAFQLQSEYLVAIDTLNSRDYRIETQRLVKEHEFNQLQAADQEKERLTSTIRTTLTVIALFVFSLVGSILFANNRKKQQANEILSQTLTNLKATQSQLIQSEKMASLGELTAGIAHEIQNPLNFVNNFSELNTELVTELEVAAQSGQLDLVKSIARDIKENEDKINHHGKRAGSIVKGMLQHSRTSSGMKEITDINALCDEYLRLAYHGFRAKDKSFHARFETDLDSSLPKINVVPQDIGRVILNLINNAFYACIERSRSAITEKQNATSQPPMASSQKPNADYEPTVTVSTRSVGTKVVISVSDNGNGIPDSIKDKIFQPFFTTKPTGQGTGLGLSLSYDIVTKGHRGELEVDTTEGEGSTFIVTLPA